MSKKVNIYLSVKHLRINPYTFYEEEVKEGVEYGFWRVVEHTNAGWFPWPGLYFSKKAANKVVRNMLKLEKD